MYFDEGFFGFVFWWRLTLWLHILMKVSFFSLKNEGFTPDFVFWQRLHTLTSYFFDEGFVIFWVFSKKRSIHTWLRILMKVCLASYFDESFLLWLHILTEASYFGLVFWWRLYTFDFLFWWRFSYFLFFLWKTKPSHLTLYFDEGFFGFIFWRRLHTLASYFDGGFFGFIFGRMFHTLISYFDEDLAIFLFFL
jgi:hypothetical protein